MVLLANPGNAVTLLEPGIPITLVSAVALVQTLANCGQSTNVAPYGTGTNPIFTVSAISQPDRTLNLNLKSTTAVPTTVSVTLYYSSDGGSTWNVFATASALSASTVASGAQILHLAAGLQYQLMVTTLTLGSAGAVSVDGTLA